MPDIEEPAELTVEVRRRITEAFQQAYEQVTLRFDRSVGFDNQTFGQMVFKSAWHYLENYLKGLSGVKIHRPQNSFEVQIGRIFLHPYKVGMLDGAPAPVMPNNENVLKFMAESYVAQGELFPDVPPTRFVLAHVGDSFVGLKAVYLGLPMAGSTEASYEWAWVARIDTLSAEPMLRPDPVEIEIPDVVSLVPDQREAKGSG